HYLKLIFVFFNIQLFKQEMIEVVFIFELSN
ncbi:MAG: hypothetical protein RIT10_1983, partial [Bacteroidota bacterium]